MHKNLKNFLFHIIKIYRFSVEPIVSTLKHINTAEQEIMTQTKLTLSFKPF